MSPTIILLAPEGLALTWKQSLTGGDLPLLGESEVLVAGNVRDVQDAVAESGGAGQLLLTVLGKSTASEVTLARGFAPQLSLAIAEDTHAEHSWTEQLLAVTDFPIVTDLGERAGYTVYSAASRFLSFPPATA